MEKQTCTLSAESGTVNKLRFVVMTERKNMDKSKITVTMPIYEYEQLKSKVDDFYSLIRMLQRANQDGKAMMTDELRTKIEEIYY